MNISLVIPVYNEEKNIKPLYSKLIKVLKSSEIINDYETIFVDDGSTDETWDELTSIKGRNMHLVKLGKNTGRTNALKEGFKKTKYGVIVTLDGDLQNDPEDIGGMLEKLNEGYDCVCGWRFNRNDPFIRKASSKIANSIRRLVLKDNFHDTGCGLIVLRKSCLSNLLFFEGAHRFIPVLVENAGHSIMEHKIKHHPRKFGRAKYNIRNRIFKSFRDLIYVKRMMIRKK